MTEVSGGDEAFGKKIVELENKVALLEEEKGNLQLKVVELEESSGDVRSAPDFVELQAKFSKQSDLLDDQVKALADLEKEKLDLIEGKKGKVCNSSRHMAVLWLRIWIWRSRV